MTADWTQWVVVPDSGFRVDATDGQVEVAQLTRRNFEVRTRFEFAHPETLADYRTRLIDRGVNPAEADERIDAARTIDVVPQTTDFASVPQFLGWFERSYGRHTLAAILHDNLIVDAPNDGAFGSDTLADSFFRDMIRAADVPYLKRWLMWTAVAARTRWAVGGHRRWSVIIWAILGVLGVGASAYALVAWLMGTMALSTVWAILGLAFVVGVVASVLWGRQYGAGLVAALTGIWVIPATVFVLFGLLVYCISERLLHAAFPTRSGDLYCPLRDGDG